LDTLDLPAMRANIPPAIMGSIDAFCYHSIAVVFFLLYMRCRGGGDGSCVPVLTPSRQILTWRLPIALWARRVRTATREAEEGAGGRMRKVDGKKVWMT